MMTPAEALLVIGAIAIIGSLLYFPISEKKTNTPIRPNSLEEEICDLLLEQNYGNMEKTEELSKFREAFMAIHNSESHFKELSQLRNSFFEKFPEGRDWYHLFLPS